LLKFLDRKTADPFDERDSGWNVEDIEKDRTLRVKEAADKLNTRCPFLTSPLGKTLTPRGEVVPQG
jgi:hypothetical protein